MNKENASVDYRFAPFISLYNREMQRFIKVIFQTVFTPMINSTLYLLIFGVSLGQSIQLDHPITYLEFLIPGLVMMSVVSNAFQNSSSSIVSGKFQGDLEDWKIVPLSGQQTIWALSIGGLTRGVVVGLITFLVGEIFVFVTTGSLMPVKHPFVLMYFLTMGGLAFAKFGIPVAFWAKTFDQVSAIGSFVLLPLIYLGGVFFSLSNLHPFWQAISQFNPVLYFINGVRYGILGVSDVNIGQAAIVSAGFVVIAHIVALRAIKTGSYARW